MAHTEPTSYNAEFFDMEKESSVDGARVLVPRLIAFLHPSSVVDVGCGLGAFLAEFRRLGVERLLGVDGEWTRNYPLMIEPKDFLPLDLTGAAEVPGKFDLALCLEVGEHLDERYADPLVHRLTSLAPAVCFSAGVPSQRGTHHVNLRYPEYWASKFRSAGFVPFDLVRADLLPDASVPACYAQNTLVYVREGSEVHSTLRSEFLPEAGRIRFRVRNLAHPTLGKFLNRLPGRWLEFVYPYYTAAWYRFIQPRTRAR